MSTFVHLHNHSHYSLGDAITQVEDYFTLAQAMNMNAVAITEHGNLFSVAEFTSVAKKYDIKPIIGSEIYMTTQNRHVKKKEVGKRNYYHLTLLAKNYIGYQNLCHMISLGYTEGFYYRPRIDLELLQQYSEGIIVLSGCMGGYIPYLIRQNNTQELNHIVHSFKEWFGENNFFIELMHHKMPEDEILIPELIKLAKQHDLPLVATNDVHYAKKEDFEAHEIFLAIKNGHKLKDPNRQKYPSHEFYFKSFEEMKELFEPYSLESLTNTSYIADLCNFQPEFKTQIPTFESADQDPILLQNSCYEKLKLLQLNEEPFLSRLKFELDTINRMGFASYFLIVQDFILYAKNNNILVGPGRGSAAGSLTAYLLGITDVNPISYGLLFERFLNPGRISMPDIDTDFDDEKREKIIEYVINKYGKDKVANIITFGRMKSKMVLRDVGRVLDIPIPEIEKIIEMIPINTKLKEAFDSSEILQSLIQSQPVYQQLWDLSTRLEGRVRHPSIHAAGVIIGKETLKQSIPLYQDAKTKTIATMFEGKYLEEFGFLKMDFLGLRNLRTLQETIMLIKKQHNIDLDLNSIELNDQKTFEIFQKGYGVGIFQCESHGIIELMKKISPTVFEDIIALLALYRPGPLNSGMARDFVHNKKSKKINFFTPALKDVLKQTYGVMIYQEQIMEISKIIGNFSLEEADNLRKAMGKKQSNIMMSMKQKFIQGAIHQNYDISLAENLFQSMEKFAAYGFNKSHSTAYALISYRTAFFKAHYSLEYMCSLLKVEGVTSENLNKYYQECRRMEINILMPDINLSEEHFSIQGNQILFGLSAIKHIGNFSYDIVVEREKNGNFTSLEDFLSRLPVNKKLLEALITTGCFNAFEYTRNLLLGNLDVLVRFSLTNQKKDQLNTTNLFETLSQNSKWDKVPLNSNSLVDQNLVFRKEKEYIGFYLSGHPLDSWKKEIEQHQYTPIIEIISKIYNTEDEEHVISIPASLKSEVRLCGIITNPKTIITKSKQEMLVFSLEDFSDQISALIPPQIYNDFQTHYSNMEEIPFEFTGYLQISRNLVSFKVKTYKPFTNSNKNQKICIHIDINQFIKNKEQNSLKLKQILKNFHGEIPTVIEFTNASKKTKQWQLDSRFFIQNNEKFKNEIQKLDFIQSLDILL